MVGVSRRVVLGGLAGAGLGVVAGGGAASATGPTGPAGGWPPVLAGAAPDRALTGLFDAYSDSGVGWTGADSTYSVRLPDGRLVWIFSDTLLGPTNPDGSRPRTAPFINNSFVVQRGRTLTTVHGGTAEAPAAVVAPDRPDAWYWAGAGQLGDGTLDITYHLFRRTGTGMWDWAWASDALARFRIRDLSLIDVTDLPSAVPNVQSASWLARDGGWTLIYRTEDLGNTKYLHVARVRGRDLRRDWQFWTGSGWSAREADSARVMPGVSNEFSVTRLGRGWLLLTQDTTELFSTRIVGYFATSPTGPFTGKTLLYGTPETGGNIFTYNPHVHPELSTPDRLLVSYNVNSLVSDDLYGDVSIYRPRFVDVRFRT
jgi:hypothetical protein